MKKLVIVSAMMLMLLGGSLKAASDEDVSIHVTPIVATSLLSAPTYYHYGSIEVNTSSNSANALVLQNDGDVSVTVDKQIVNDGADWSAHASTVGTDQYVLYCATSASRVDVDEFSANTEFGAQSNVTNLTGSNGDTDPVIAPAGTVNLWFQLDMPDAVSNSNAQEIVTRFTAAAE